MWRRKTVSSINWVQEKTFRVGWNVNRFNYVAACIKSRWYMKKTFRPWLHFSFIWNKLYSRLYMCLIYEWNSVLFFVLYRVLYELDCEAQLPCCAACYTNWIVKHNCHAINWRQVQPTSWMQLIVACNGPLTYFTSKMVFLVAKTFERLSGMQTCFCTGLK